MIRLLIGLHCPGPYRYRKIERTGFAGFSVRSSLAEGSVMAVNSGINWLYYSDGGRQLYVLNLSDPDFKFPSIPFECALPDNCRITMLKVSVDNLALFVGVETDRPEKYKGDVYKINAKDGTILEHYQRFGGTPWIWSKRNLSNMMSRSEG